jgi:transcriptional regulator with XRE-family HTH domain
MAIQRRSPRPQSVRLRLGNLLRQARLAAGLTQGAVARRVGCPISRISRVELGQRRLYMSEFFALARALNVDPAELLSKLSKGDNG